MQVLNVELQRKINGGYQKFVSKWQMYAGEYYDIVNPTGRMYLMEFDRTRLPYGYRYEGWLQYDD